MRSGPRHCIQIENIRNYPLKVKKIDSRQTYRLDDTRSICPRIRKLFELHIKETGDGKRPGNTLSVLEYIEMVEAIFNFSGFVRLKNGQGVLSIISIPRIIPRRLQMFDSPFKESLRQRIRVDFSEQDVRRFQVDFTPPLL